MASRERTLVDLAGDILDGAAVDWSSAEPRANDAARLLVGQLRVLAAIADHHRRLQADPEGAGTDASPHPRSAGSGETASGRASGSGIAASRLSTRTVGVDAGDDDDRSEHWGPLRVLEQIGRGAFGVVFRAWDTRLDREVALKLLPAPSAEEGSPPASIIEEGRLLARVHHPNVVTIYGAEQIEDRIGLWMEFVRGATLEQLIRRGRAFNATDTVEIGIGLCHAMSAVHGAGLLHRDVKAQNVMIADEGRVVLMDFGSGRDLRDDAAPLSGTPLYLAPEVLSGGDATVQSDLYSVGVLLYHLLTRSYPVCGRDLQDLRRAHEHPDRVDLGAIRPDLPGKLRRVIERAIDPRPDRRYQSADALAVDLAGAEPSRRFWRTSHAVWAAALVLGTLVSVQVWNWQPASGSPAVPVAAAAATGRPPTGRLAVAVLPLTNLSNQPESDYLVDGLRDEIARELAAIDGLDVRSRTSSIAFKNSPRDLREVGRQLGISLAVEGSVLRSGARLRVNVQLVRVADDVLLWSERFDRRLEDVFSVEDEISRAIVNTLRLRLGRGQRRYDTDLVAYHLYLKARALVDRRGTPSAQAAAALFRQVIGRDPGYAPAYAGLAEAYAFMSMDIPGKLVQSIDAGEALAVMRPTALKALELDPLLAEAHAAMGYVYARERDWEHAQKSFRQALDLNPSLSQIATSYALSTLIPLGMLDEAEQLMEEALRTDPLSLTVRREMAQLQIIAGRYPEAIGNLLGVKAMDPDFTYVDLDLARALTFAGRLDEALPLWQARRAEPGWQHWMASAFVATGRRAEVEAMVTQQTHPYRLAVIYAALGDREHALEALDRAADVVPQRVALLLRYPELAPLRGDPRFAAVCRRLGLP